MSCKHLMLMLQTVKQPENGGTETSRKNAYGIL